MYLYLDNIPLLLTFAIKNFMCLYFFMFHVTSIFTSDNKSNQMCFKSDFRQYMIGLCFVHNCYPRSILHFGSDQNTPGIFLCVKIKFIIWLRRQRCEIFFHAAVHSTHGQIWWLRWKGIESSGRWGCWTNAEVSTVSSYWLSIALTGCAKGVTY